MMKLTCISCPRGCRMVVERKGEEIVVTGNECKRGEEYAVAELTCPMRTITSSIFIDGGDYPLVSVKTKDPVPKAKIKAVLDIVRTLKVTAPTDVGDVIVPDVGGTGVDLVATRKVKKVG